MAVALVWEVNAALRRGWSQLRFGSDPAYRNEQPFGFWRNVVIHAVMALVLIWAGVAIWGPW
jgi:hypothetical protein